MGVPTWEGINQDIGMGPSSWASGSGGKSRTPCWGLFESLGGMAGTVGQLFTLSPLGAFLHTGQQPSPPAWAQPWVSVIGDATVVQLHP